MLSTCAGSDAPGLGQGNLSARRQYDDTGPGAFRRFVHSVDVTDAGWQVQSTDFCTPPQVGSLLRSTPPWVAVKVRRSVRMSPRLLRLR